MARLGIRQLAEANGEGVRPPSLSDRLLREDASNVPADFAVGEMASLVGANNTSLVPQYDLREFGSVTGGDDTSTFQAALNSELPFFVPPGAYNVSTLDIPFGGCSMYSAGVNTVIIRGLTTNQPVIRWSHGGDVGDFRLGDPTTPRIEIHGLRFDILYNSTSSLAQTRDNCTVDGCGYGPPIILFERSNFPIDALLTPPGFCHLPAHITLRDLVFRRTGTENKNNFTPCVMFQGAAPACYLHNLQAQDPNCLLGFGAPFVQRVTTSGNRIVTAGANKFQNGQRVQIRSRGFTGGIQPSGVNEATTFTVSSRDGSGFDLAEAGTIGNGGRAFAILVGDAMGDYVNEGQVMTSLTNYTSRSTVETSNCVSSMISGLTSYGAQHIVRCRSIDSAVTTRSENFGIHGLYSESPEGGPGGPGALIRIDADGVCVTGMQMRGASSGSRPVIDFEGADHHIASIHGRSNNSTNPPRGQGGRQPHYRMFAENVWVHGNNHEGGLFTGSDARGRVREDGGGGNHLNTMSSW